VGKALSFTHELSFTFFINPPCSAVDDHQMYFGGSVVGKSSTIGREISPSPPLIFTGGQKMRHLASFKISLNFEPPAFDNAARYPNSEKSECCDDRPMSWPCLVKFGLRTPEKALSVVTHPVKLHAKACQNLAGDCSIRFCSNFVQTLTTSRLMYNELSRSTSQRSRSQRDITYKHKKTLQFRHE